MTDRPDDTDLSRALRAARTDSGTRQLDVAGVGRPLSQARLSRIENGQALPTADEVRRLGAIYGLSDERVTELVAMTERALEGIRDTRLVVQRGNTLAMAQRWRALEQDARTIRSYQPILVLGVLQTARYAAVAMKKPVDSPEVRERMRRLENPPAGRRMVLIQTEGALRQVVGSPEVMAEQIDAIVAACDRSDLQIGIVQAATPMPFIAGAAFHLYDDSTAVVGLDVAAATLTNPGDVRHFRKVFDDLANLAVWGEEARTTLAALRQSYA